MNDLFDYYPQTPGYQNTDTSRDAAHDMKPKAETLRLKVLGVLRLAPHGLTTQEISERLLVGYPSIQPRTSELRNMGMITDSGRRRLNSSGKKAIVWWCL
jgi:hypothetical protein